MQQQIDVFIASLTSFWTQLAGFVPQLLAALLLLFLGWLLANVVRTGVMKLLDVLHFDRLAEKTGIEAFLKQGNLDVSLSRLLAKLAYWVIIFVVFVALEQLAIGTTLLTAAFQIGFGAIGLAFALAFGLGGREWAAGVIKKLTEK